MTDINTEIFQKRSWHQKSSSRGRKYLNSHLVLVRQAVSGLQQPHESEIELDACWSFGQSVPGTGVSGTRRRCSGAPFTWNTGNANLLTEFPNYLYTWIAALLQRKDIFSPPKLIFYLWYYSSQYWFFSWAIQFFYLPSSNHPNNYRVSFSVCYVDLLTESSFYIRFFFPF